MVIPVKRSFTLHFRMFSELDFLLSRLLFFGGLYATLYIGTWTGKICNLSCKNLLMPEKKRKMAPSTGQFPNPFRATPWLLPSLSLGNRAVPNRKTPTSAEAGCQVAETKNECLPHQNHQKPCFCCLKVMLPLFFMVKRVLQVAFKGSRFQKVLKTLDF